jgi:hypothetical protein
MVCGSNTLSLFLSVCFSVSRMTHFSKSSGTFQKYSYLIFFNGAMHSIIPTKALIDTDLQNQSPICHLWQFLLNRESSVILISRLQFGRPRNRTSIAEVAKRNFLFLSIQGGSGAQPASNMKGSLVLYRGKAAGT